MASKLELAREMGATDTLNANNIDPVPAIRDMTGGAVHYAFEAIGTKGTAEQAFQMLRPGGKATIIGMVPLGVKIELHGYDFLRDRKLQGPRWAATDSTSRCRGGCHYGARAA